MSAKEVAFSLETALDAVGRRKLSRPSDPCLIGALSNRVKLWVAFDCTAGLKNELIIQRQRKFFTKNLFLEILHLIYVTRVSVDNYALLVL